MRGDQFEGTSIYRPLDGLVLNPTSGGAPTVLPGHAFEATARTHEIFVFCLGRKLDTALGQDFAAEVCIEILNVPKFCERVTASLPPRAKLAGAWGHQRVGHRVRYYNGGDSCNPRWACPDLIATSKLQLFANQEEFRLLFTLTNAFDHENGIYRIVGPKEIPVKNLNIPEPIKISIGGIRDFSRVHSL